MFGINKLGGAAINVTTFEHDLAALINGSGLPIEVMSLILRNALLQLDIVKLTAQINKLTNAPKVE